MPIRTSDNLKNSPRAINDLAQALRPMSQSDRVNAVAKNSTAKELQKLGDLLDPAIVSRAMVAPWGRDKQGVGQWAVPGIVAGAMKALDQTGEAMRLPPGTSPDHPAYKGVFDVAGAINLPSLLRKGATTTMGMNLYHGGPNKWAKEPGFPQGRPRLDKMGSGEGNQAYGHGFYSAQKPEVAQTYKTPEGSYQRLSGHLEPKTEFAFDLMERGYGTSKIMEMMLGKYGNKVKFEEVVKSIDDAKKVGAGQGNLYKIDIPDQDVAKYIDWDAPLSAQSEFIQKSLSGIMEPDFRVYPKGQKQPISQKFETQAEADSFLKSLGDDASVYEVKGSGSAASGAEIYRKLIDIHGSPEKASEFLKSIGIPGTRFLDEGSRVGTQQNATRNYVTWDQKVLDRAKVLQRNEEIYKQLEKSGVPFT